MKSSSPVGDLIAAIVLGSFGIYIITRALSWVYTGSSGPGPGFFPFWYGVIIVALSAVLALQKLRSLANSRPSLEPEDREGLVRVGATLGALTACVLIMPALGFLVSFSLLSFFLLVFVFRRPWVEAAVCAVLFSAAFYLVFTLGLQMRLPVGLMGI